MHIYYKHCYKNEKGESHRLLERAIAAFISSDGLQEGPVFTELSMADCSEEALHRAAEFAAMLQTEEHGKPFITGFAPFSISHSNNTWAVLMDSRRCGLDVQYPRRADTVGISDRFFAPEDAAHIRCRKEDFFRLWARREALVKAAGTFAADKEVPSVLADKVLYRGSEYCLKDIELPGAPAISAAVCILCDDE